MPVKVAYIQRGNPEIIEVDFTPSMVLPRQGDRIVSPFDPDRVAKVAEILSDTPRNRFQVLLTD